jgi:hypothetical protein
MLLLLLLVIVVGCCGCDAIIVAAIVTLPAMGAARHRYHCWCRPALRSVVLSREEAVEWREKFLR